MKVIKIQRSGNANIQCGHFYKSIGVLNSDWKLLKAGEVIEIPFRTDISLRGVEQIGNPFEKKEEIVIKEKIKIGKDKKSNNGLG